MSGCFGSSVRNVAKASPAPSAVAEATPASTRFHRITALRLPLPCLWVCPSPRGPVPHLSATVPNLPEEAVRPPLGNAHIQWVAALLPRLGAGEGAQPWPVVRRPHLPQDAAAEPP